MNRLMMRLLACVAVSQVGAVGAAVASQNTQASPDDEAWQQAVSVNSLEAYAKFSMDFPDSQHVGQARAKLSGTKIIPGEAQLLSGSNEPGQSDMLEFIPNSMMVV